MTDDEITIRHAGEIVGAARDFNIWRQLVEYMKRIHHLETVLRRKNRQIRRLKGLKP